ncbi:hypothetical protein Lser_V15G13231 [Lactuca serriola]
MQLTITTNRSRFPAVHFAISYLSASSHFHSSNMAAVSENATTEPPVIDDNVKFGFLRKEMNTEKLAGTAIAYDRHVILCYKTHETWPSRVESSDSHPFPKLLAGALKARKNDIPVKTLMTICEGREGTELSDGDVLLFPEMVKYRGLKEPDINSFVDEVIVNRKQWSTGVQEKMTGSHIFVCAHSSRDKRCGFCGPILIKKFKEEAELRGLKNVYVSACSHVGGHKYAGNLIIYSVQNNKVSGHWYGYVSPNDVPELLDDHIGKGQIIERIWRGQMGVPLLKKVSSLKAVEPSLPNGNNLINEKNNETKETKEEKEEEEENIKKEKEEEEDNIKKEKDFGIGEGGGGCCQGLNGFSCCRDEKEEKESKSKIDLLWKKWEENEIVTVAVVVGVVVTVGLAYSFYKRIR